MRMSSIVLYMFIGMGVSVGLEAQREKEMSWADRAFFTATWPSAVAAAAMIKILPPRKGEKP